MSPVATSRNAWKRTLWGCCLGAAMSATGTPAFAASPTAEQALALMPVQKDVDFDRPTKEEVAKCSIEVEKYGSGSGWAVKDPDGRVIRRFIDTNGDNTVDQWSYYADGLEVYRDVDSNANGKADQSRWLNTGGSRWGIDKDEDGKIDSWKVISAEEVSAEAVRAMADRDVARFQRLLLTADELKSLGLGEKFSSLIGDKLASAPQRFTGLLSEGKIANVAKSSTRWLNFSGSRPGLVPSGTDGSTKDLLVYENVAAMMDLGEKTGQVQIGTMIRLGDVWRLVDVPKPVGDGEQLADASIFFNAPTPNAGSLPGGPGTDDGKGIFDSLQDIEDKLAKATDPKQTASLKRQRADLIEKALPALKETADRQLWTRQLIDTLSEGVQTGTNPEGLAKLKELEKKLADGSDKDLVSYARFSAMTAEYIQAQSDPKADFTKVQSKWLDDLRTFVKAYPKSPETSEAMLHLAIDAEFAAKEAEAKQLYGQIAAEFPQSTAAKKAAGSVRRLDSLGKVLPLTGTTTDGKPFDLKSLAGKAVVLYYWSSVGPSTAGEIALLKEVQAKYAREATVVGINLDADKETVARYLTQNRLPWVNLYEAGGMDGRLANDMGILTVPTIMIVDAAGKVANRNIHITGLSEELGNIVKR